MTFFNIPYVWIWIFLFILYKLLNIFNLFLSIQIIFDPFGLIYRVIIYDFIFIELILWYNENNYNFGCKRIFLDSLLVLLYLFNFNRLLFSLQPLYIFIIKWLVIYGTILLSNFRPNIWTECALFLLLLLFWSSWLIL